MKKNMADRYTEREAYGTEIEVDWKNAEELARIKEEEDFGEHLDSTYREEMDAFGRICSCFSHKMRRRFCRISAWT